MFALRISVNSVRRPLCTLRNSESFSFSNRFASVYPAQIPNACRPERSDRRFRSWPERISTYTSTRTQTVRLLFCGPPQFAVPTLRHLLAQPDFEILTVITQPNRPRGPGQKGSFSPIIQA